MSQVGNNSYSQEIGKYAVKIKYHLTGSGVLIKVDESVTYLITAKHNFKKKLSDTYKSVKIFELEKKLDEISITRDNGEKICTIQSIVYEESDLDLIIFKVSTDSSYIKNLPSVSILKDNYALKEYFFYGYPNDGEGTIVEELNRPSYYETREHIFRLNGHKGQKEKYLKGFSGSGLFTECDDIIYLIGIVIKVDDKLFHYECIDLSKIIESINNKLNTSIDETEDIVDLGFSQNIYTRILNRNKNTYLVKRILNELNGEKKLDFLKQNNLKREEVVNFLDMDEKNLLKTEKELADLYLLKAMIYYSDENEKYKQYFTKAGKFNSRYKTYELTALDGVEEDEIDEIENNEEFNPLQKAKLYFIENKYDKVIEILTKEYVNDLDTLEKIESYKYLSKSYEQQSDIESSIGYLSEVLEKSKTFEKPEIYYELSILYMKLDDREEALKCVIDGLDIIDDDTSNIFLEIEYKLIKQKKKLLNSNEENVPNMTLTELFKKYPEKYMDEYLESLKDVNIEVTNKEIIDEIRVLQKQIRIEGKKD
ncbi:MAG: DNA double-strand break repair Rad50 ATPase [uncultured Sulfurovum sp.]|uniref:DNA double-strand break repair Rad50 ATPase n=1 Tax=uncultured Sulfurovum sp. TaxID=269237 RepID=A0A6S6RU19_9BACT|nr:MAG: DNA double-strand break repair Rad50 ATPase [uncultured Sulfurovum sp.]